LSRWRIRILIIISPIILHMRISIIILIVRGRIKRGKWNGHRRRWGFKQTGRSNGGNRIFPAKEVALIKVCSLANDCLLGHWIVEFPGLVAIRISNEYTLLHVGSKTAKGTLILLNVDIGNTSPNSQSGHIRLDPIEDLIRCLCCHSRGGDPIPYMNE
jgi:hypothetical protein